MLKLMVNDIPLTNFLYDKNFRLYNRIRGRISALIFQRDSKNVERLSQRSKNPYFYVKVNSHIKMLQGLLNRLVYNSLNCNDTYKSVYQMFSCFPKTIKEHSELVLGFYIPRKLNLYKRIKVLEQELKTFPERSQEILLQIDKESANIELMQNVIKNMKQRKQSAWRTELIARVVSESQLRVRDGWFVFFNTLTCKDSSSLDIVFSDNSKAWTDFIRLIDRRIGIECYGSWRKALEARRAGDEFHTYFAVVERGDVNGRPHIHCIHFAKKIPASQGDPNFGLSVPLRRELKCFNDCWSYGWINTKIIRIDGSDAYANLGWRWPHIKNSKTGQYEEAPSREADSVAGYLASYLYKEFKNSNSGKDKLKWRIRKSQSLGKTIPQKIVNESTVLHCETIVRMRPSKLLLIKGKRLPFQLLKKLAMQRLLKLKLKLTPMKYWKFLTQDLRPAEGFMKRLSLLISPIRTLSTPVNIGDLRILTLLNMVGSSLVKLVDCISIREFGPTLPKIHLTGNPVEVRFA